MVTLVSALGGLEALKWLAGFWMNRRTEARKQVAVADSMVEENNRKQVDWLERRVMDREERLDALNEELRRLQEEKMDWMRRYHELELAEKLAAIKRCDIRGCAKRVPPSDY